MLFANRLKFNEFIPPFVCVDNLFTDTELEQIIKYCENRELEDARIVNSDTSQDLTLVNKDIRVSDVAMIHFDKEDNNWLFEKLWAITKRVNGESFQYDLTGFEAVQYTVYEGENSRYDFHTDMATGKLSLEEHLPRKLSFSLVLSDPDNFEGGDFQFYFGGHKPETITQKKEDL